MTTWTIAIDWNRDGDYSDSNEDMTSQVISANWFLGMRQPYQESADNSMLQLLICIWLNANTRSSESVSTGICAA